MVADEDSPPALTGARMVQVNNFDLELAPSVVLVYDQSLVPPRATKRHHRSSRHPFRQVGSLESGVDIVVAPGSGAPVAAITVEFLAAMGVEQIVTVGQAGLLSSKELSTNDPSPNDHSPDNQYVISRAESDEGTSRFYSDNLAADAGLTSNLSSALDGCLGVTLTTDVPFRHTPSRLRAHRARADLVEMECAAVFSAAHHFGVVAGAVLVVSDVFDDTGWRQLEPAKVKRSLQQAVQKGGTVLAHSL